QAVCEVSNMEPVRATIEADLAVAPLLSHSVPESLDIIATDRRLPKLPMFRVNLYQAARLSPAAAGFAAHVRRSVAGGWPPHRQVPRIDETAQPTRPIRRPRRA